MTPIFDKNWTLFLDRDGVINERLPGKYISTWAQFEFTSNALAAIKIFNKIFGKIIIVTNQQGIGKGLMTDKDLNSIHKKMENTILKAGGRIDGIYYCPDLKTVKNNCRKPNPAMALQAQKDFPGIDFQQSIIVGDSISDIVFGQQLKMYTVFIQGKKEEAEASKQLTVDERHSNLYQFALTLEE